jgi:hypothetical protein
LSKNNTVAFPIKGKIDRYDKINKEVELEIIERPTRQTVATNQSCIEIIISIRLV